MKFSNTQELIEYVSIIGEDRLKSFEITFKPISVEDNVPAVEVPVSFNVFEGAVSIKSFSDAPTIKAGIDEALTENVLYVEDYDSVPMACSTGKVTVLGRTIYTNVCESEDGPTIYLNVMLNEKDHSNVPFKLKKTHDSDSDYIMLLNPKTLSTNE
ncbi:predicted ORF [Xanthomonas phage XacN1]|nr:predicted ORF [Xanthomonas phage XacN1]